MSRSSVNLAYHRLSQRPARIAQCREEGFQATIVQRGILREFHITLVPKRGETIESILRSLHGFTITQQAVSLKWEIFGPVDKYSEFIKTTREIFGEISWPVIWAQGLPCDHEEICGVHAFAVSGAEVETIWEGSTAVGTLFSDPYARHCLLGNLQGDRADVRERQVRSVFDRMDQHLRTVGMALTDVARTWLYLDKILDWYGPFNVTRREIFEDYDIFKHMVPASTGIGASNPAGSSITAGAWAVQWLDGRAQVFPVSSPLQCPAPEYGSCFSRGVQIDSPDHSRLLVSGTASIAPGGSTEHVGDIQKQISLTMDVVEAILTSRGARWKDATRATLYFKKKEFVPAFTAYLQERSLQLPAIYTEADVCRDDLLFEIEVDTIIPPLPG